MEENTNVTQVATETTAAPKEGKKFIKRIPRKKVCAFCQNKVDAIDYKDINTLKKYITEKDFDTVNILFLMNKKQRSNNFL